MSSFKAVLFDFNGVIINDEAIHDRLLEQILIEENMRPKPGEFRQYCLGRSDRACLTDLFSLRGRFVSEAYLEGVVARKAIAYAKELAAIDPLPIYPGVPDLIFQLRAAQIKMAIVSGALRSEIDLVLQRAHLQSHFSVIVSGDGSGDGAIASKPAPDGYLKAVELLNQADASLNLKPEECLAIEDTFAGIEAAKRAGISVVGVANSYPLHMLQRRANWVLDYLTDLELDRVRQILTEKVSSPKAS